MKKIVILGGNGMLGSDLQKTVRDAGIEAISLDLPNFQITDAEQLEHAVSAGDCLINCAAYTAVDKAESEPELCAAVNSMAVATLGRLAKKYKKYVVHISTDFVFGDLTGMPQSETDQTNPLSVYGATKLRGEHLLVESGCDCSILRAEWTYGVHGNNFISKILIAAKSQPQLRVVADQFGAPTDTISVCRAILNLLDQRITGTYHFANSGYASRYEVAKFIVNASGLDANIEPCNSSDFTVPAVRPKNSRFNCSKIDQVINFKRKNWQDALTEFIQK